MFGTLKKKMLAAVDDYCGLINGKGEIIICSDSVKEGESAPGFGNLDFKNQNIIYSNDLIYSTVNPDFQNQYFLFIRNSSKESEKVLRLLVMFAENYLRQQLEKHNKFYFYKKLLNDELTENEIYENIAVYKIRNEADRAVIVFRHGESDYPASDMILNIFPEKEKNTIVEMDNNTVAYLVELNENEDAETLVEYSKKIADTIEEELMVSVRAGIGSIAQNLSQMALSYSNASTAITVGSVFEFESRIFNFNSLGIGKMIYSSDKKLLDEFLRETISKKTFELLDDEIIKTVLSFFTNNLNISETARRMYLHRNTLVYRIEKILKLTGLDLRNFDDAVSFKAAYMVKCFIDKLNQDD
ncbi:MAG: helix-turn-helix domain-containing protein [Clostridiales bacterium]|nr:helix-turn-helix domain-containing protein [Clostridiales bacterium]